MSYNNALGILTKEEIKEILLNDAENFWDKSLNEQTLDPLVNLLMGALSAESHRVRSEILNSQARIIENLANIMLGNRLDFTRTAHALAQIKPRQSTYNLSEKDSFFYELSDNEEESNKMFFSPLVSMPIANAEVKYMAVNSSIYQFNKVNEKEPIEKNTRNGFLPPQEVWLGIVVNGEIEWDELSFYFGWKNRDNNSKYLPFLPHTRWYTKHGVEELPFSSGFPQRKAEDNKSLNLLQDMVEPLIEMEEDIEKYYEPHFITLPNWETIKNNFVSDDVPPIIKEVFTDKVWQKMVGNIVWISVSFPPSFPVKGLEEMNCALNICPVLNRKREMQDVRVNKTLHIVPLHTNDQLLSVDSVVSDEGKYFKIKPFDSITLNEEAKGLSFQNSEEDEHICYVRSADIGRFDNRDAYALLEHLLDLIKNEGRFLEGMENADKFKKDLKKLNEQLQRLREMLKENYHKPIRYLLIQVPEQMIGNHVEITYWTTNGSEANNLRPNKLFASTPHYFNRDGLFLLTRPMLGKDKPSQEEVITEFKKELVSRNRIVTLQDVILFCKAELGQNIMNVRVEYGVEVGILPNQGLQRVINVILKPSPNNILDKEEWEVELVILENKLAKRTSILFPFRVFLENK